MVERSAADAAGSTAPPIPGRIRVLPAELADQIAAGEVVERPASILKELLDNAIDAGATRIELELAEGGIGRIVVVDDGAGITPDDLRLAITRHATSKVGSVSDLVEPSWLGFRGEALASIAAVAHVVIDSRTAGAPAATQLRSHPGLPPTLSASAGVVGTRIEVSALFANVPARRKFLRTAATELTHCVETVSRIAIVHPQVAFRLRHEGRIVLDLPRGAEDERLAAVLGRRGAGSLQRIDGTWEGIGVRAWIGEGSGERPDVLVVVRRRVIRERAIAQIVREAWPRRTVPVACIIVDPPHGTVDVNVHPQKSEVRFSEPQRVYAAVRRAMAGIDVAPQPGTVDPVVAAPQPSPSPAVEPTAPLFAAAIALPPAASPPGYALRTRAAAADYSTARERLRADAEALREVTTPRDTAAVASPVPPPDEPELLACLPGPVALMRWRDDLLAVDLRALRSFLLQRRLVAELGGGTLAAQALLVPAVVQLSTDDVALCGQAQDELAALGLVVDGFGDDAVVVRTVPAELRRCVDDVDAAALLARVLPYLRARRRDAAPPSVAAAASAFAEYAASTVAPRFARRFVREVLDAGLALESVPGVRRWRADELVESP